MGRRISKRRVQPWVLLLLKYSKNVSPSYSFTTLSSLSPSLCFNCCCIPTQIKNKIKFSLYLRKFRRDRYHIWLTASSYMVKYLRISSYIRKPFLIQYMTFLFLFLSVYNTYFKWLILAQNQIYFKSFLVYPRHDEMNKKNHLTRHSLSTVFIYTNFHALYQGRKSQRIKIPRLALDFPKIFHSWVYTMVSFPKS